VGGCRDRPLRRRISRALAGLTLRLSNGVLVRDEGSAQLARAIRGRVDGVIPDPALLLTAPDRAATDELAIVVRPPIAGSGSDEDEERVLVQALADCADSERPTRILTFAGDRDRAFANAIADAVAQRGRPRPQIEELAPVPRAGLDRLARCGVVVSIRLHGMILAAVAGRPFVAIAYDAKVRGVADELNAADLVVEPRSLAAGTLQAALERAVEPTTQRRIALRMTEIRQRRAQTSVVIGHVIRGEP
jgi:polysaccharide pyruvyl transferase WcaK-like protein